MLCPEQGLPPAGEEVGPLGAVCRGFSGCHLLPVAFELITDGQRKILGSIRGPGPSVLWGRISRGWSSCFHRRNLALTSLQLPMGAVGAGPGQEEAGTYLRWHLSFKMLPFERGLALVVCLHL